MVGFLVFVKIVRIPSKLYYLIYSVGGDKLLAVYATLKVNSARSRYYNYIAKNNRKVSGYGLLRAKTNISLSTLKNYIPYLVELGLCEFTDKGFSMLGSNRLKLDHNDKMVPLVVSGKITDTSYNMMSVRFHSLTRQQERQIIKKQRLSELKSQARYSSKAFKKFKKAEKSGRYENFLHTEYVCLSNEGYAKIKDGEKDNKSRGEYWKRVAVQKGLVSSERVLEKIQRMSYSEYTILKSFSDFDYSLTYYRGFLCKNRVSTILPTNLTTLV